MTAHQRGTNDGRARLDRNEAVTGLEDDPVNDEEILAVEAAAAAARFELSSPSGEFAAANLQSAVAAAVTKGQSIRDVAVAAHLTVLEVLDAADAVTYRRPA